MADDGARQALWTAAGATVSMSLMTAVSATVGGPDGVAGVLGGALMTGAGIVVVRALDRDAAASAAYEVLDQVADHGSGGLFEEHRNAA